MTLRAAATTLAVILSTSSAASAQQIGDVGALYIGLLKPLLTPAYVIALFALGFFIAQQVKSHRLPLVLSFAVSLLAGWSGVVAAFTIIDAVLYVLGVAGMMGLFVAIGKPIPLFAAVPVVMATGILLEFDSTPQLISMRASAITLAGAGLGSCFVATVLTMLAAGATRQWQHIGIRIVGSWIAASAVLALTLSIVR